MAFLDEMRRRIKDWFSHDEQITVRPAKSLELIEQNLLQLSPSERNRQVEHIKAYATLYYQGRHNEHTPSEMSERLRNLERRTERLNSVDEARKVLAKLGGPPSRETVLDAVERSFKERSKEYSAITQNGLAKLTGKTREKNLDRTLEHTAEV